MHYKIASLILNSGQKPNTAADIFIAQPDGYKEAIAGKLFILAEVEAPKNDALKIIDFLINSLNSNYYNSEKLILKEKVETITVESILEGALSKTNKEFFEFLEEEKIKIGPWLLNITAGILYQNELYLTSVGKNKNYLIYKEKIPTATKHKRAVLEPEKIEYRAIDLNQSPTNEEAITPNKLFSEISGGKIPSSGYFLVINEAMSEYLSPKQLIKIATKLPPAAAMEQIKNTLEQVNSFISFLGILVKNTAISLLNEEELKKKTEKELEISNNKPEIVSIEEKTEAVLAPAGILNIKKQMDGVFKKSGSKNKSSSQIKTLPGQKNKAPFMLKDKVFFKKRPSFVSPKKIFSFLKKLFSNLKKIVKEKDREVLHEDEAGNEKNKFWNKNKIKFATIGIMIIIAVFSVNLIIAKQRNKSAEALKLFNERVSTIERNLNKIEAYLLYGNNPDALVLWQENEKLFSEIPEKDKTRETIATLQEKHAGLSDKIKLITKVSDMQLTADFSKLNSSAAPHSVVLSGESLYAADKVSAAIYKVDLKENIVTASYDLPDIGGMEFLAAGNNNIYSLGAEGIVELSTLNQGKKLSLTLPSEIKNIRGFKIYNNRAYLVDKENGQIYRYDRTEDGFTGQSAWLNSKIDLTDATDIFINGDVYILKNSGQVEKYLRGQKQDFPSLTIENPISAATRLIIGEKTIYILEPEKKRLAVFELETGKLSVQYIFDKLSGVKDFSIDENNKKLYILSEVFIYEMPL